MPRTGLINGNGYKCDLCQKPLRPHDVFRVRCAKTIGHTGELKLIDSIGVCEDCYRKEFPNLCGKGLLRTRIKGKKIGIGNNND